jgi:hypothetical protein
VLSGGGKRDADHAVLLRDAARDALLTALGEPDLHDSARHR